MTTPKQLISELEHDIFKAEDIGYSDWKFLDEDTKERIRKVALFLVLEGWSK